MFSGNMVTEEVQGVAQQPGVYTIVWRMNHCIA